MILCDKVNTSIFKFAKMINCSIHTCYYNPIPGMYMYKCHHNCKGDNSIIGYYVTFNSEGYYEAHHHSVIVKYKTLLDITPNIFNKDRYIFFKPVQEMNLSYIRKNMRPPRFK